MSPAEFKNEDKERSVSQEELITSARGWSPTLSFGIQDSPKAREMGEEELYTQRSKLFCFHEGQWEERGWGDAHLLRHGKTGRVRFVLLQDKTRKVVANHYVIDVSPYCDLVPNAGSEKCWVWSAQDFSDNELRVRQFGLKFGSPELATMFKTAFDQAKELNAKAKGFAEHAAWIARPGLNYGALQPAEAGAPGAAVRAIEEAGERACLAEEAHVAALRAVEERAQRLEEGLRAQEERCGRSEERAQKAEERAQRAEEGLRAQEERRGRSEERAQRAEEGLRRAEGELADVREHLAQLRRRQQEQEEVLQQVQRHQRYDRQRAEGLERDLAQERSAQRSMEARAPEGSEAWQSSLRLAQNALQVAESAQLALLRQLRQEREAEAALCCWPFLRRRPGAAA